MLQNFIDTILDFILGTGYTQTHVIVLMIGILGLILIFRGGKR